MGQRRAIRFLLLLALLLPPPGCLAELWSPAGRRPKAPRALPRAPLPLAQSPRAVPLTSHAVKVDCEPHRVVVTVHRDLFGVGRLVAPLDLALGRTPCWPVSFDATANVVVFAAGLHECGSALQMTPDLLIYQTSLFYTPSLAGNPIILRTNAAEIPIECRYPRKENVSSQAIKPTWVPMSSTVSAEARLGFSLRLMNDDWSAERTSTRFRLGDVLRLQADVHAENHWPLRLFVDSCVAGLSPGTTSVPQYAIVDSNGCLVDGRQEGVSSTFLSPRPRQEVLRFTIDAFRFAGDSRNLIYIMCDLKVTPVERAPDALNKACSFNAANNAWLPVEGSRSICNCCETGSCGRMMGEQPQDFGSRHLPVEMSWQRNLPVETAAHQAHLALGPIFIFGSRDRDGQFPGGPEDAEEIGMEEFMPVIESQVAVAGTPLPFKENVGSANISEDQKDNPALPLEAYLRAGPVFIGEAEEGSGFGDQAKAALPEEDSTALELQAKVISRPLEEAVTPSAEKLPGEAASVAAAKGPERRSGVMLALLLLMAGLTVGFLALGVFVLVKRCRRRRLSPAPSLSPLGVRL
ncbi:zona pellucida sperm-binding protein 3-like [Elgaria multicarinata webbii]|uniref:zona pellucida sperm-binding protein 3-like n=1 Tax=Elgaria multicarinata webbii TaxID=159646 RepID=UPI002FCD6781